MTSTSPLDRLCHDVMTGVVKSGIVTEANMDRAITVMRAEIKAFLTGDDYADERDTVLNGSVHPGYVMASVVASCVNKIGAAA